MKIRVIIFVVVSAILLCGTAFGETVMVKSKPGLGDYLTDSKGMTLYYFKADSPGKSTCMGGCIERWPVFHSEKITVAKGLNANEFGAIKRADGKKQTTFRGYPLYYFVGDGKEGDANGEGAMDVWFIVNPAKFMK